jgi:hypothetical protein
MFRSSIRRRLATTAVAGLGTAIIGASVVGLAGPANAETASYADPQDASGGFADIRKVKVTNEGDWLTVRVRFDDLRKRSSAGATVYVDNTGDDRPDYAISTGLSSGTDYGFTKTRGWKVTGRAVDCDHDVRLNFKKDVMVARVGRHCLGFKETFAAAVKTGDVTDGSHPIIDWLVERRYMTDQLDAY